MLFAQTALPAGDLIRLVAGLAAIAILIGVGVFVMVKLRGRVNRNPSITSEVISNFREIHSQGGLSDKEFRNIKTLLADRLEGEVRQSNTAKNESSHSGKP
jgi:hypothetical protein